MNCLLEGGTFHHIGVATRDLAAEERSFAALGYRPVSEVVDDPVLGIRCRLLEGPGPRLELVCDLDGSGVVEEWLARGTKFYHLAFEIDDVATVPERVAAARGKIVQSARPARLFDGRPVVFAMLRSLALVEFIEKAAA